MKQFAARLWNAVTHQWGRKTGRYYVEDFIRVYPDGRAYNRLGLQRAASPQEINNFRNHQKFYGFASQFARDSSVADVGCGSGYGCAQLKQAAATRVFGADISKKAITFAQSRYGNEAEFTVQGITDLSMYGDDSVDVVISSEVLEHIKEYQKEDEAVSEVKRITRPGGIVVFGTPNSELLGDHGFWFDEMKALMSRHFSTYCIFENALVPYGEHREVWEERLAENRTGVTITQEVNLAETVLPESVTGEIKQGMAPGVFMLDGLEIDTTLLHNTHSWVVVAVKEETS